MFYIGSVYLLLIGGLFFPETAVWCYFSCNSMFLAQSWCHGYQWRATSWHSMLFTLCSIFTTSELTFLKDFPFPLSDWFHANVFTFQRHDIFKKRIDFHGNVLEVRQDGIGAPKVSVVIICEISSKVVCTCHVLSWDLQLKTWNILVLNDLWLWWHGSMAQSIASSTYLKVTWSALRRNIKRHIGLWDWYL